MFTPAKPPLTGETLDSLAARLAERGEPKFRAKQILDWLYKKRARSWDEMSNLSKPLRAWLDETFDLLPATLLLDKQGRIAARVTGETTAATVTGLVDDVLAEG